jgi:hypothetical protein
MIDRCELFYNYIHIMLVKLNVKGLDRFVNNVREIMFGY